MYYWIYETGKTVHFIGLISWFAGLFYLPRLFIYHVEALEKMEPERSIMAAQFGLFLPRLFIYHVEALEKMEPERSIMAAQFGLMEKRLYKIIMNPAMVLTYIGGFTMIFYYGWDWFVANNWMHWKLGFVFLLTGYHHYSKGIIRKLSAGNIPMSSTQLRYYNEIATVILLAIVLLAVFKSRLDFIYAFVTIIIFMFLLMMGIKTYKNYRKRKNEI